MTILQGFHRKKPCFVSWSIAIWEERERESRNGDWSLLMELLPGQDPFSHFLPAANPITALAPIAYKTLTAFQEQDTRDVVGILREKP